MNGNGENGRRLTRLEEFVEVLTNEHIQFAEEHKRLLTAQVVLTDRLDKLAQAQVRTDEQLRQTDQRLRQTKEEMDERIGVLIRMMDDWIKRQS
jgi:hypothetical protein